MTKSNVEDVKRHLLHHISRLGVPSSDILFTENVNQKLFLELPKTTVRFSNICVKIEHYDTTVVHRNEVASYSTKLMDGFGEFFVINSKFGNIRTSAALTSSSIRAARCTADLHQLIVHAFVPECIRFVRVHMMIATKSLGHPIIIHGCHAVSSLQEHPNWRGRVRVLDEEVGRRQCLEITWLNPEWLEKLSMPATPSQCIINLYRNGLVNVFLAFSPGPSFEVGLEQKFIPFLNELFSAVDMCT